MAVVFIILALDARAADILDIGAGPRPMALGEAYAGLADDAYAARYNPAGLAGLRRQEAAFAYNRHLEGVAQQEAHYALPTGRFGTFAVSASSLKVDPFDGFDADDQPADAVSAQDLTVGAHYAFSAGPLMAGVGGKFLDSRLADARARGAAWDAGALYQFDAWTRLGLSAANVGQSLKYDSESSPLPRVLRLGASSRLDLPGKISLLLTAQGSLPADRGPYPSAGLEFTREELFAIRAGYSGRLEAGQGWSVGAGLKLIQNGRSWYSYSYYSPSMPDVEVDYAFVPMAAMGDTHRIGLLLRFGPKKEGARAAGPEKRGRDAGEPEGLLYYESL